MQFVVGRNVECEAGHFFLPDHSPCGEVYDGTAYNRDATRLLECEIHETMPDAEAAIKQSSTLCKGQSITDGKILEKGEKRGTVLQVVRSFTFKSVWFSRFLLVLLNQAMTLLGA
jgi:hypothetical protein